MFSELCEHNYFSAGNISHHCSAMGHSLTIFLRVVFITMDRVIYQKSVKV